MRGGIGIKKDIKQEVDWEKFLILEEVEDYEKLNELANRLIKDGILTPHCQIDSYVIYLIDPVAYFTIRLGNPQAFFPMSGSPVYFTRKEDAEEYAKIKFKNVLNNRILIYKVVEEIKP